MRWVLPIPFLALIVYTGLRLLYAQDHPRPSFWLNEDLSTSYEHADYGIGPEHRITEVNGVPVKTRAAAREAFDASDVDEPIRMRFESDTADPRVVRTEFIRFPKQLRFEVDGASMLIADPSGLPQTIVERADHVTAVSNTPLTEIAEQRIEPDNLGRARRTPFDLVDPAGQALRVVVESSNYRSLWVRFVAAVSIIVLGIGLYWLKPGMRSSAGFLIFSSVFGSLNLLRSLAFQYRLPWENVALLMTQSGLIPASVVFLLTFTSLRVVVKRPRPWILGACGAAIALMSASIIDSPITAVQGIVRRPYLLTWAFLLLGLIAITLAGDYIVRLRGVKLGPTDRQRSTLIRMAVVLAFGFPTVGIVLRLADTGSPLVHMLTEVSVLLFPLLVGYAIIRHNLLQLNELARESLIYGLLIGSLVGVYAAASGYLAPLASRFAPMAERWVTPAFVAATIVLAIPLHSRARHLLDRRFNRVPFDYDIFVESLDAEPNELSIRGAET